MSKNDKDFFDLIKQSNKILVIIPDRPDGDSLASALLLESLLERVDNKEVYVYCGVNIPEYVRFIPGWDRVFDVLPTSADMTIVVDNSSMALLGKFDNSPDSIAFKSKPFVVVDHHASVESDINYATLNLTRPDNASAGELIYEVFNEAGYQLETSEKALVMQSILSDTLGLTSQLATAKTYRIMADLIDSGVNRTELEDQRREYSKMDERVFRYKASLIERTELYFDNSLAICVITEEEAYDVGTLYNPGPLILSELLMIKGLKIAIAIKSYHNRLTAAIRTTSGNDIADKLAQRFNGGGHSYSAGFKIENWDGDLNKVKNDIITELSKLLK